MKRLATYTFLVLITVASVVLLWQFRFAAVLFAFSLAFAAAVRPAVERLVDRGWRRSLAMAGLYALIIAMLVATAVALSPPLLRELQLLADQFTSGYDRAWTEWPKGSGFQQAAVRLLPPPLELYQALTLNAADAWMGAALGLTLDFFGTLGQILIVLVLSIYWAIDRARFERLLLSLVPAAQRTQARDLWASMETAVGAHVRSEISLLFLAGWLLGIGYSIAGLPFPVLLALLGALAWLIPWIGTAIAVAVVLAVGWASAPGVAVLAALYTAAIFIVLARSLEPRLLEGVQVSPILMILALIALVPALGLLGFLLAPPLAAAAHVVFAQWVRQAPVTTVAATSAETQLDRLSENLQSVRERIAALGDDSPPHLSSLADRLQQLIEQASASTTWPTTP
ncbi:MAG TPA: AI-2E family transporter [Anaerolineales bacterium]|nr:AI-2E family transporter [Anaerolineales bacterium]